MSRSTEFLDGEEERILDRLKRALSGVSGDETVEELRAMARRHPELTLAASVALGALLAPMLVGAGRFALPFLVRYWRSGGARTMVALIRRCL